MAKYKNKANADAKADEIVQNPPTDVKNAADMEAGVTKDSPQVMKSQEASGESSDAGNNSSSAMNKTEPVVATKVDYGDHYVDSSKKKLKPNVTYQTEEGYVYTTDEKGRIISVEGTLQYGKAERNKKAQVEVGKGEGRRDGSEGTEELGKDDGGHLIASIFLGSGDIDNLVPMNSNLNRGKWRSMEKSWAKMLEQDKNTKIEVKIRPIYEDNSQRPTRFVVKYRVNNGKWQREPYENEKGGEKHD